MDVLFLSISMGAGHLRAAHALSEYVLYRHPKARTLVVDTFKYINPITHKLVVDGYLSTIKINPDIYGMLYRLSECRDNINTASKIASKMLSFKIKRLIEEFKPSIIACTHPFPLQMLSCLKRDKQIAIPSIGVLTDYVNHPMWFHDNIEAYVVGHDYIKKDMVRNNIPEDRIFSYGIPVSKVFLNSRSKQDVFKELDLDNKFTLLVMGGSLGFGDIENTYKSLLSSSRDIQLIVVTGKNSSLKRKLESINNPYSKKVRILGYVHNISDLMDCADLIVTKPGGMTISEALIKEVPILLISPIPGQEERNANFLINSGVAARISKKENIENVLCQVIDNPVRYKQMKEMSKVLAKPHSGQDTVNLMEILTKLNKDFLQNTSTFKS